MTINLPGADTGFLVGGEPSPYIFFIFVTNLAKLKEIFKFILLKPFEYIEMIKEITYLYN